MDNPFVDQAAGLLLTAREEHQRIEGLPEKCRPQNMVDAYLVQDSLVALLDLEIGGWKVGATNPKAQKMLGTTEPFAGRMFTSAIFQSPAELSMGELFAPGIEVELAFRLGKDLPSGRSYGRDEIADAVAALYPAIEIVDTRYTGGLKAGIFQIIADNGAHGAFILGDELTNWRPVDRLGIAATLVMNDVPVSSGVGSNAAGGDPLESLVWLANKLAGQGNGLMAGDLITTGSCCEALGWAKSGDVAVGAFAGLGSIEARFS